MAQISKLLRSAEGETLIFRCPGCKEAHQVKVGMGPGPRWRWNGNTDRPSLQPSVLVKGYDTSGEATIVKRCHSFIDNGQIRFLTDCTHRLAGQTVDLDPWEEPNEPLPL